MPCGSNAILEGTDQPFWLLTSHGINISSGSVQAHRDSASSGIKIGLMKDEVRLPDNFDEVFDSLDDEVASLFTGAAS